MDLADGGDRFLLTEYNIAIYSLTSDKRYTNT